MWGSLGKHEAGPPSEQPTSKRRHVTDDGLSGTFSDKKVMLNPADCNIDFTVGEDGLSGSALHHKGFGYCWSGARATLGARGGRYYFGCKVIETQPVETPDTAPNQRHLCRVGVSRGDDEVECLGESAHSFGYGGTGKFSNSGKFLSYGEAFGVGDTIVCAVDLEAKPLAKILFWKNGKALGVAKEFDAGPKGLNVTGGDPHRSMPWQSALFPHVLLKNVTVKMQFDTADGLVPVDGYKPWHSAFQDGFAMEGPALQKQSECEVLMMVGLPASGKTTWAEKRRKDFPEKRYVVLGTNLALDVMKVPGLTRKRNYEQRFELLMDRATEIFNKLLERAANINRNYILDQTNVYKTARKRKLRPFDAFRKIAVVVFPAVEELRVRTIKRTQEMGKEVPVDAVNEMKANYILPLAKNAPYSDEFFDEVWYVELPKEEAEKILQKMKNELPPITPQSRGKSSQRQSPSAKSSGHGEGNATPYSGGSPASVARLAGHAGSNLNPYSGGSPASLGRWQGLTGTIHTAEQVGPVPYSLNLSQGREQPFNQYDSFYSPRTEDVRISGSPHLRSVSPAYLGFEDDQFSQRSNSYDPYLPGPDPLRSPYPSLQGRSPAPSPQYIQPHLPAARYSPNPHLPPPPYGWQSRPY